MTAILALAVCAVLAGCRSFTAIGESAADAPDPVKSILGVGGAVPCESTIRRTLQLLDGDELDTTIGTWAAGVGALSMQCVRRDDGIRLPRARTRRALLLTVKGNQPGLFAQLKKLPWKDAPILHRSADRAHGRVEKRSVKVVTVAAGILFPHARQAIQLTRKTRRLDSQKWRTEVAYAVTSLTAEQATVAELATRVRSHWHVENRLHWVRDVTLGEDASQVRTGNGPRVMASLRNLVISMLRLDGATNIAETLRHHARNPLRPVKLILAC